MGEGLVVLRGLLDYARLRQVGALGSAGSPEGDRMTDVLADFRDALVLQLVRKST